MSVKLQKKEKLQRKIASKSREWIYLKESQEDFDFLYDAYESELNQALADLSQFHPAEESKEESAQGFSSQTIDSEGNYDDLGNLDISDNISSNSPSWAKNLYKQIALHTHPDKVQMMEVGEEEKNRREQIFKSSTQSLQEKKFEDLIYSAHKLNLDIGINNQEYLDVLNHSIEQITKSLEKKKDKPPWHWGRLEGSHQSRCELLHFIWNQTGISPVPPDIVMEYLKHFENDTIESWKLKYTQSSSEPISKPKKRKKPGPSIGAQRRSKK